MKGEQIERLRFQPLGTRAGLSLLALCVLAVAGSVVLTSCDGGDSHARENPSVEAPAPSRPAAILIGKPVPENESWQAGDFEVTHGVASGDVSATSALVWARASKPARMLVDLATNASFRRARRFVAGIAGQDADFAVTYRVRGLRPDTVYHYRIWFAAPEDLRLRSRPVAGRFRTAPRSDQARLVQFAFSGDIGSNNYCRHAEYGFPIFHFMGTYRPDFFVSLGDTIYADTNCSEQGPNGWRNLPGDFPEVDDPSVDWNDEARVQEIYYQHWRYTRGDRQLRAFLAKTPIYSTWDDHEVMNDFGAPWTDANAQYPPRAGFQNLVQSGRRALFAYGVLERRPRDPTRLYRFFRWGRDLQLFVTDTRTYRSRNEQRDAHDQRKTLLGAAQLAWLKESLAASRATWKVIASSVSVAVPTGSGEFGRDGWADGESGNGFELELVDLLRFLDERNVKNVVFITADLHFAQVTRHVQDYNGDGDTLLFHEVVAGPLNARTSAPYWLDLTTNPKSLYGEGNFFNFGFFRILPQKKGKAILRAATVDSYGKVRPDSVFLLRPR